MRRREFISLLGGAAAWPLAAQAQQSTGQPLIGLLSPLSAAAWVHILGAFRLGMRDLGYVERANVAFAIRYADGQVARLPALANEPSSVMNVRRLTRRGRVPTRGARAANNSGFRLIKASNSLRLLKTSCFH